ncbi:MAG: helix-hairpin-helix domain-containing protein, partial [Candidatus Omnitrophota bacterium]
ADVNLSVQPCCLEKTVLAEIDESARSYSIIDINTAGIDDIQRLKGVGPVLAAQIIAYRDTNGPFRGKEDLLNVKGIGPKIYESIEDNIRVE